METLYTDADERERQRLFRAYEKAKEQHAKDQQRIDALQADVEAAEAALRRAEVTRTLTHPELVELQAAIDRAVQVRDVARKQADAALTQARSALQAHTNRFVAAACGWLGSFEKNFDYDGKLVQLCQDTRRRLDRCLRDLRPLPEIGAIFAEAEKQITAWKLPAAPQNTWLTGKPYQTKLTIPRIADFFRA